MIKHTPGPWRWEFNRKHKTVSLVGGKPAFDKTVMDFERWGLQGACPRFNEAIDGGQFNVMTRVSDMSAWVLAHVGRRHHADWCANIIHPDAKLIAAAPDLLAALKRIAAYPETSQQELGIEAIKAIARVAIEKAEGDDK